MVEEELTYEMLYQTAYGEYQNVMNEINTISFFAADKYKGLFDILLQSSLIKATLTFDGIYEEQLHFLQSLPQHHDFFANFQFYIAGEIINWDNFYQLNDLQKLELLDKTNECVRNYLVDNFFADKKIQKLCNTTNFLETASSICSIYTQIAAALELVDDLYSFVTIFSLDLEKNYYSLMDLAN